MNSSTKSSDRWRFRDNAWLPAPRLAALSGVAAAGTAIAAPAGFGKMVFFLSFALLAVLAGLDAAILLRTGRITARRKHRRLLELDEDNPVQLVLSNPSSRSLLCRIRDDYPQGFGSDRTQWEVRLPPRSETRVEYRLRPHRRGRHTFASIHLRIYGQLGLIVRQRAEEATEDIHVYPRLKEVRKVRGGVYRKRLAAEGSHIRRGWGRGADFSHIRDYVAGDEPRRINWTATARKRRLATNVYQPEQGQPVVILIDCGRAMGMQSDGMTRLDRAVESALAFAAIALERGDRVSLIAFSNRIRRWVPPGKGGNQLKRLIDACHDLEPDGTESGYRIAMETLNLHHKRRTLVTLFTEAGNLAFADELADHIRILQRRHLVMTVTQGDPVLERLTRMMPETEEDVFRKGAALQLKQEQEETLDRLKRRGVVVLHVPPGQLAEAAIHSYLEIKNRSLL